MSISKTKTTQKRKKHAPEYKARVVLEIISGKRTVAEIARVDKIKDSMLYEWRNEAIEKLPMLFRMDAPVQSQSDRERELEQLIGQMTIENQALKKASQWLSTLFAQKRAIVSKLSDQYGVAQMCTLVGLNRSSYYHAPQARSEDAQLEQALRKYAGKRPRDGYRRLTQTLRRRYKRYQTLNTKRVRRVMKQAGIQIKRRKKPRRTTNSQHAFQRYPNLVKNLLVDHPHQVWVGDIAAIVLADDTEVFLAILMDVFTRKIVGWELARDMTHLLPLAALKRALRKACPEIHHTDQGVQYATPKYTQSLLNKNVQISMAAVGKAWENGYAERWVRTLREEELSLTDYKNFADAYRRIGPFISDVYNRKRIHSSLGYLTPAEFEAMWREQQP